MKTDIRPINIEILEITDDQLKVKIPFIDIPVKMNHHFFYNRLDCGYFNVLNKEIYLPDFN